MASYQARRRDPLVDQKMQAAIERRGKELLGAFLSVLGAVIALMLVSYSADDPSWFSVSD
ncbi:MAG: DNA translocase FtsK 4TM domain-containing protein, partial [Rhodobacteraceae bacterium]|nr:DNA translocase FtsK 4TM domain-containing protein [Paracoccaceae bacterium]